jgi:hypothetical protein
MILSHWARGSLFLLFVKKISRNLLHSAHRNACTRCPRARTILTVCFGFTQKEALCVWCSVYVKIRTEEEHPLAFIRQWLPSCDHFYIFLCIFYEIGPESRGLLGGQE